MAACLASLDSGRPPQLAAAVPSHESEFRTLTAYGPVLARRGKRGKVRPILTGALQQAQACGAG